MLLLFLSPFSLLLTHYPEEVFFHLQQKIVGLCSTILNVGKKNHTRATTVTGLLLIHSTLIMNVSILNEEEKLGIKGGDKNFQMQKKYYNLDKNLKLLKY